MTQDMPATPSPMPEQPAKRNTWLIIVIVVLVLCCLCVLLLGAAWQFGDAVIQWLQQASWQHALGPRPAPRLNALR